MSENRRVIQITVVNHREGSAVRERLYALADDGTMWRMDDSDIRNCHGTGARQPKRSSLWMQIPHIPSGRSSLTEKPDNA